MRCPHCLDTALSTQTVLRISRHACKRCKGMWLDMDGLEELRSEFVLEAPLTLGRATGVSSNRLCPQCQSPLAIYNVAQAPAHAAFDVCSKHGLWMDQGELDAVLAVFLSQKI